MVLTATADLVTLTLLKLSPIAKYFPPASLNPNILPVALLAKYTPSINNLKFSADASVSNVQVAVFEPVVTAVSPSAVLDVDGAVKETLALTYALSIRLITAAESVPALALTLALIYALSIKLMAFAESNPKLLPANVCTVRISPIEAESVNITDDPFVAV